MTNRMNYLSELSAEIERITTELELLPDQLSDVERQVAHNRLRLKEVQESLELAQTNAMLAAQADAKDAETRKLQRQGAVWQDETVKAWEQNVKQAQEELDSATVDADRLRRKYAAFCHIAHLKAAQMTLMAGMPAV